MKRSIVLASVATALVAAVISTTPAVTHPVSAQGDTSPKAAFMVTNGNDRGPGSYRTAIARASADDSADVITLNPGLRVVLASDVAYTGSTSLTLNGNGSTIDGNGHQILVARTATKVVVNRLDLTGGQAVTGGAIETGDGDVTIRDSTLSKNTARGGNGVSAAGGAVYTDSGSVTIIDSTLSENRAIGGTGWGASGGAVESQGATITRSTLSRNSATGDTYGRGGAIYSNWDPVTITRSVLGDNSATGGISGGGAVYVWSDMVAVTDSTLNGNTATGGISSIVTRDGGGAVNADDATIRNSTLRGNSAVGGGGGAVRVEDSATIDRSTIDRNSVRDYWGFGGGAYAVEGTLWITNSTITRNEAVGTSNEYSSGGGARSDFGHITIQHSTFASNSARYSANVSGWGSVGTAFATVFTDPRGGGSNCNSMYTSAGYNYSTDGSCGLDGPGDAENGAGPKLSALGNYGGQTNTRPPRPTSPLVNAIPHRFCDPAITTDQREQRRPETSAGRCDIGAVELRYGTAPARPDGRIKKGTTGTYHGDNIYDTRTGQTVRGTAAPGKTVSYIVSVQNDARFRDTFGLTGTRSTTRFTITYSTDGTSITRAITNGTYRTRALRPGGSTTIRVRVAPRTSAPVDAKVIARLTATSTYDPNVSDTVRSITTRS